MVSNAVAGAAVGYTLGLTADEIKAGIESLPSIPGRNHIIETDHMIILDDCYNANPISMKASIDVLNMAIGRGLQFLVIWENSVTLQRHFMQKSVHTQPNRM